MRGRREGKVAVSMGKATKKVSFLTCQKMCSCRFAWHAWHFVTCDVFQEECVCATVVAEKLPCQWGKPQKRVFLDVSEDVLILFCVAGVALCDMRCVSGGMCVRHRREGKVALSSLSLGRATKNVSFLTCQKMCSYCFVWQAWRFVTCDVFQEECVCATVVRVKLPCQWGKPQKRVFLDVSEDVLVSFCVPSVALYTPVCTLHFTLTLYTRHSTLYTPHLTLHTLPSTLSTPNFTLHTFHSTLHTLQFAVHIPHSTLHTLHFTLHTPHSTLYTPHFTRTLHTLHSTVDTPHFTLHTLHSKLYTPHFTHLTPHSTLHTLHSTLYTPHSTLHTLHSTLYTLYFTLHTPHFTLYTPHSTLHALHSTLYTHTPHSTLHS